jgi:predicted MFS family arabinose efflux permease
VIRAILAEVQEHQRRARAFSRNARVMLLALGLLGVGYGAFTTLFTLYIVEIGYSEDFLGLLIGVGTLGGVAAAVPAGLLCDRIGARRGLLIGTLVTAVGVLIECTVTTAWLLLAGGLVAASGVTLLYVAQAPFLAANSGEAERTHLFSVAAALLVAVSIAGSLFAGSFPALLQAVWPAMPLATAYRATLLAAGAVSSGSLLPLTLLRDPPEGPVPQRGRSALLLCARSSAVRRLVVTGCGLALGGGLVVPFVNLYFAREFEAGSGTVGLIRSFGIAMQVVGSLAAPWLGLRLGLVGGVAVARLVSAPFLLLIGMLPILPAAAAAFALRTFFVYLSDPLHTDFSMRVVPPEARATANSLTFLSWNATLALGGWAGGQLIVRAGYEPLFLLGSSVTVAAAAAYWLAFRSFLPGRVPARGG